MMQSVLSYAYWPPAYVLWRNVIRILWPCLIVFFLLSCRSSLHILVIKPLSNKWFPNILSPCTFFFHFLDSVPWDPKVFNSYEVQFIYFFIMLCFYNQRIISRICFPYRLFLKEDFPFSFFVLFLIVHFTLRTYVFCPP